MDLITLIFQLGSGAVGSNILGSACRGLSLGKIGNSLAGIIGGGLSGHLLGQYFNIPAIDTGNFDLAAILGQIGSGAIGGIVVLFIVGVLRNLFSRT